MAKRLRLKKSVKIIIAILIILIILIITIVKIRKVQIYHGSYEYKLLQKGYTDKEIKLLEKHYNETELYKIAIKEKDETRLKLLKQKKYKEENYTRYVNYINNNNSSINEAILMVNINRDHNFYEKISLANANKKNLILVNKYLKLEKEYIPDDLVKISTKYAWGNDKKIKQEVYDAFIEMWNAAKSEDIYLMVNLAYRSYEDQEALYNRYKDSYDEDYADGITIRPGHSEHQTGLALDIFELHNSSYTTFKNTTAYKWLKDNAYKYGFILRYTEENQNITGFNAEDWHYRYVGKKVSQIIYNKNITLEEYYYNQY